ncbi:MAG: M67 family metallopeptidase [Candidatus Methylomirabilota bacterium]
MKRAPRHLLEAAQLAEIIRQAERGYPDEVCGAVIGRRGEPAGTEVRPLPNIAGETAPFGPDGKPRSARSAYLVDPLAECRLLREIDDDGREILFLYHSHPDADAGFSALDRAMALTPDGDPWWPGVSYLVISVHKGRARSAAYFSWDPASRNFIPQPLPLSPLDNSSPI